MPMDEPTIQIEAILDAALDSYPLAPLPDGFIHRTMYRVRVENSFYPQTRPGFYLEFLDLALPLFLIVLVSTGIAVTLWIVALLDPVLLEIFRIEITWWLERNVEAVAPAQNILLGLTIGSSAALLAGASLFAAVSWWTSQQESSSRSFRTNYSR